MGAAPHSCSRARTERTSPLTLHHQSSFNGNDIAQSTLAKSSLKTRAEIQSRLFFSCFAFDIDSTACESEVRRTAERIGHPAGSGSSTIKEKDTVHQSTKNTHSRYDNELRPHVAHLSFMFILEPKHVLESSAYTSTFCTATAI